jgi:hypothetical protein
MVDLVLGTSSGVKATGADWFAADLEIPYTGYAEIEVNPASAMTLEYTVDGTNYATGAGFSGGDAKILYLPLAKGDLLNLRQSSGGNVTVTRCRVFYDQ